MYLSNIKLWNFRKYGFDGNFDIKKPNLNLDFNKTLNVLIGENDSGKTAIVDAIKLVLKTRSFEWIKLNDDDFFNGSQRGRIELTISDLSDDEAKNFIEWLSYDKENKVPYLRLIYDFSKRGKKILSNDVCAGPDENGTPLNAEAREFLKAVYLKPLRDAQTELTPGKYSRLASILNSNDTINEEEDHLSKALDEFNAKITSFFTDEKGKDIANKINDVIKKFCDDQKQIEFKIAQSKNLKDILTKLELSIQEMTNPGLGTLNRLYMAAELLNLQDSSYEGLKLGLIEELEAHLHPQAQMKVIEHLQKLSESTQFILTTHSPNLASKVKIENLILCDESNCFPMGEKHTCLDKSDYIFLQKFLDVTKSNLFFAKGILFVEGWAEEIFLPSFANFLKSKGILKKNLTEAGVSIINVGSTAFLRFSKIFQRRDEPTISTPVGIITDSDVKFYQKTEDGLPKKIDCKILVGQVRTAKENKEQEFNAGDNIRVFLALNWTFEFALHQSKIFSSLFHQCTTSIHTQIDQKHFEEALAQKLLTQKLKKTDIAYSIAQAIDEGQIDNYSKEEIETDNSISYLVKALKFTCNQ